MMLGALMACYPPECFNQSATMKSIYQIRIERSGLHPETNPTRLPEDFETLMYHSLPKTSPANQDLLNQPANNLSDTPISNYTGQPISYSKLKKRNLDETSS